MAKEKMESSTLRIVNIKMELAGKLHNGEETRFWAERDENYIWSFRVGEGTTNVVQFYPRHIDFINTLNKMAKQVDKGNSPMDAFRGEFPE